MLLQVLEGHAPGLSDAAGRGEVCIISNVTRPDIHDTTMAQNSITYGSGSPSSNACVAIVNNSHLGCDRDHNNTRLSFVVCHPDARAACASHIARQALKLTCAQDSQRDIIAVPVSQFELPCLVVAACWVVHAHSRALLHPSAKAHAPRVRNSHTPHTCLKRGAHTRARRAHRRTDMLPMSSRPLQPPEYSR